MSTHDQRWKSARKESIRSGPRPAEAAATLAAQLHGVVVWLVVLVGLSGFRSFWMPVVTAYWMFELPLRVAVVSICTALTAQQTRTIASS